MFSLKKTNQCYVTININKATIIDKKVNDKINDSIKLQLKALQNITHTCIAYKKYLHSSYHFNNLNTMKMTEIKIETQGGGEFGI